MRGPPTPITMTTASGWVVLAASTVGQSEHSNSIHAGFDAEVAASSSVR